MRVPILRILLSRKDRQRPEGPLEPPERNGLPGPGSHDRHRSRRYQRRADEAGRGRVRGSGASIGAVFDKTPPDSGNKSSTRSPTLQEQRLRLLSSRSERKLSRHVQRRQHDSLRGTNDLMQFLAPAPHQAHATVHRHTDHRRHRLGGHIRRRHLQRGQEDQDGLHLVQAVPERRDPRPKMTLTMPPKITAGTAWTRSPTRSRRILPRKNPSATLSRSRDRPYNENFVTRSNTGTTKRRGCHGERLVAGRDRVLELYGRRRSFAGTRDRRGRSSSARNRQRDLTCRGHGVQPRQVRRAHRGACAEAGRQYSGSVEERARGAVQAVRDLTKKLNTISGIPTTLKEAESRKNNSSYSEQRH